MADTILRSLILNRAPQMATFTYQSMSRAIRRRLQDVRAEIGRLEAEGLVECLPERGARKQKVFRLADRARSAAPPPLPDQTVVGNCWQIARRLKTFSPVDMAAHATTDRLAVSADEARDYCRLLLRGGYVRVAVKAIPGKREAVYRLVRDTGPLPPVERRVRAIVDQNDREYAHLPEAT